MQLLKVPDHPSYSNKNLSSPHNHREESFFYIFGQEYQISFIGINSKKKSISKLISLVLSHEQLYFDNVSHFICPTLSEWQLGITETY